MTHGRSLATTAVLAALLAAGCGGGSSKPASKDVAEEPAKLPPRQVPSVAPEAPEAAAPTAAAAGADADLSALEDIPTTEQLEQLLSESVTEENADAEFEKLQQELEAEEVEGG